MELLTEGTMHAFEADATLYVPDRRASNCPPRDLRKRVVLSRAGADRADRTSILLRILERNANMRSSVAAAIYQGESALDHGTSDTLSYLDSVPGLRIPKAA
jgi:hypothetical protein